MNVGDPVREGDGFGADALPLRPSLERSEEREREERLGLLEGRRRRLRLPSPSRQTVVAAFMLSVCALAVGVFFSHPWNRHEVRADPAASISRPIKAPKTIDRGHPLVAREPIDEGAAADRSDGGRSAPARPGAHHQKRESNRRRRSRQRHRMTERPAKTEQVMAATSAAGPSATPTTAAAPEEPIAEPDPAPISEPPSTPAPPAQKEVTQEPTQPTSSPADETAAGKGPTSVQQEFGFER